jgi:Reverse transcriptase (RNA-dependent DNA polymerase)
MDCFSCVSESDVLDEIKSLPTKQCDLDPMLIWFLTANWSSIDRFLTELFNKSMSTGDVPLYLKSAYIIQRLKKPGLDDNETRNYRPISNLPVLAKLLERLVAKQLLECLKLHSLLPRLQSAYRAAHSTETALLKVTSDILSALPDLSAAFDTVDHNILLRRMRVSYGISGVAFKYFRSYLVGRKHHVQYGGRSSETTFVDYGVQHGSILGPILFIMYTADLIALIQQHFLAVHGESLKRFLPTLL